MTESPERNLLVAVMQLAVDDAVNNRCRRAYIWLRDSPIADAYCGLLSLDRGQVMRGVKARMLEAT